ncbi:uncharacterized protein LOC131252672 [Magnolia sinica]|uniref:uncharacterized protein LOC131252672 n=1 Tax=Magnolia sinica TaxID=86752 RepID=UPI0026588DB6|nr:uncharacterized protein LOC131252672 [Magnolia sinica]
MKQCLLLQTLLPLSPSSLSFPLSPSTLISIPKPLRISASLDHRIDGGSEQLTAKERRQLRNERRESNAGYSWREEVEQRLLKKPKKKYTSWTEELNLDNLSLLGPQWWVVRVSRVSAQSTTEQLARSLVRSFPDMEFKVYLPSVHEKRKLKNGSYSVKSKPLFPGCVFLRCVLNKEIHDFIRECNGVGGFLGSKVGNTKRQINRPKPVSVDDMEAIFQQAKEEQERTDRAFEEEQRAEEILGGGELSIESDTQPVTKSTKDAKPKRRLKKGLEPSESSSMTGKDHKSLVPGCSVKVTSGPFADFTGRLKEWDRKTGTATVGFVLFGKESLVELDVNQIVPKST